MALLTRVLLLIFSLLLGVSCATRYGASEAYRHSFGSPKQRTTKRTVLLFLVDGLPVATLQEQLHEDRLPHLADFFRESANKNYILRTGFPSVTFPSIGSLLTEQSIDHHGIYGNKIILNQREVNFESPLYFDKLNELARGKNIFNRLSEKNLRSVSLSFTLNAEATTRAEAFDPEAALAIQTKDYSYVDSKFIDSLEILLTETKPEFWPDFIYIHLVGVDYLSHAYGPQSLQVRDYLRSLDKRLGKVFRILSKVERSGKRNVVALLTADHGYDQTIHTHVELNRLLPAGSNSSLNEGRYASFHFPTAWQSESKIKYARELSLNDKIDIVAYREGDVVHLVSQRLQTEIYYGPSFCAESNFTVSIGAISAPRYCPKQIPFAWNQAFYPYFVSNISEYFQSPQHPEVVIITKPGVSFHQQERGQHGGPTPQEVFVPLLLHNAVLPQGADILPLSELLKFM